MKPSYAPHAAVESKNFKKIFHYNFSEKKENF